MSRLFRSVLAGALASLGALATVGPVAAEELPHEGGQECTPGVTRYVDQEPAVLDQLGMTGAWRLSEGAVIVAVVDSGVSADNEHLKDALLPGLDLVGNSSGDVDNFGHGTAVAGQIAARAVAESGVIGVAPAARILPVRVYDSTTDEADKAGTTPNAERTARGIRWAADQQAKIIVVPLSTDSDSSSLRAAVSYATNKGALVVASAGNATEQGDDAVRFPAGYPEALSVTAVDNGGNATDASVHGVHVEIAAPGMGVLTTFLDAGDCLLAADKPSTSYATGYAAGVAALVAAAYPNEKPADWEYRLLATASRPNSQQRDPLIGWGLISPHGALNFINDGGAPGPKNPRFQAQEKQLDPIQARPPQQEDQLPQLRLLVGVIAGATLAVTALTLLLRKMAILAWRSS